VGPFELQPAEKLVDTVLVWNMTAAAGSVVLQRTQNSITTSNTRILFQLELVGPHRLQPVLKPLKSNVPRYQHLRDTNKSLSRFTTYE
jgi:LPS-assembly protein